MNISVPVDNSITEKTKIFIFSSPCNPTGSVYSRDELEALCQVFRKYPNILVISDEIYEYINFSSDQTSIASLDGMLERCVVVNGLSKGYAMTGWRLGYLAAPIEIASAVSKLQSQFTSGATSITQRAAICALSTRPEVISDTMRTEFENRRNVIYEKLSEIKGLKPNNPDGAFYFFPDVSSFFGRKYGEVVIENSDILSELILEKLLWGINSEYLSFCFLLSIYEKRYLLRRRRGPEIFPCQQPPNRNRTFNSAKRNA